MVTRSDGTSLFDDIPMVSFHTTPKGRNELTAVGSAAIESHGSDVTSGIWDTVAPEFNPELAAVVVDYLAKRAWSDMRPSLRNLASVLDHLEVSVVVDGFESMNAECRSAFKRALPYHPQVSWLVEGERINY